MSAEVQIQVLGIDPRLLFSYIRNIFQKNHRQKPPFFAHERFQCFIDELCLLTIVFRQMYAN